MGCKTVIKIYAHRNAHIESDVGRVYYFELKSKMENIVLTFGHRRGLQRKCEKHDHWMGDQEGKRPVKDHLLGD